MRTTPAPASARPCSGYLMTEMLVYISVVFVILGAGYLALYRCSDNSIALRRQADQITAALHAGERWRADIRAATGGIRIETDGTGSFLAMRGTTNVVAYSVRDDGVYRRSGSGTWVRVLNEVKTTDMHPSGKSGVAAWSWELELQPRTKGTVKPGKMRPLFTFIAVGPKEGSL